MKTTNEKSATPQTANVNSKMIAFRKFSAECAEIFGRLKEKVTRELANEFAGVLRGPVVKQVVNEAGALAASTPYPTLFFPALAEEKVREASAGYSRHHAKNPLLLAA